ncbi:dof zinc finger protein DOF1.7 [Lactuca sativa]|uniref:Dof zinc finger protein n=1 Tax=Lactuca sativa TaxID=4236 RepID=A0A9R1XL81_LACSA|nr:dof zinc finger protein DOF1.7 [Lactuca sativa]KAJ0213919.1 hypothetical protein LSAT_V11C400195220 [Lactuca sativa]
MHQDPSTYSLPMTMNPQFPEHEHLDCPRCESSNTKFCYYNNYNLSQPRHYCKNCRRYWTKGGTLRNIPIGGGTRKTNKRSSNSSKRPVSSSSPDSPVTTPPPQPPPPPPPAHLKPEPLPIFGFGNNQSKINGESFNSLLRLNQGAQFGGFVDGLKPNMGDEAREDRLVGTPVAELFRRDYLSMNNDHNQSGSGGGRGESSSCDGGNGWPNLSIFTPGSDFH